MGKMWRGAVEGHLHCAGRSPLASPPCPPPGSPVHPSCGPLSAHQLPCNRVPLGKTCSLLGALFLWPPSPSPPSAHFPLHLLPVCADTLRLPAHTQHHTASSRCLAERAPILSSSARLPIPNPATNCDKRASVSGIALCSPTRPRNQRRIPAPLRRKPPTRAHIIILSRPQGNSPPRALYRLVSRLAIRSYTAHAYHSLHITAKVANFDNNHVATVRTPLRLVANAAFDAPPSGALCLAARQPSPALDTDCHRQHLLNMSLAPDPPHQFRATHRHLARAHHPADVVACEPAHPTTCACARAASQAAPALAQDRHSTSSTHSGRPRPGAEAHRQARRIRRTTTPNKRSQQASSRSRRRHGTV